MKRIAAIIFVFCGLFLFSCGEKEGGKIEKSEIPKEILEAAAKENAVILREPSSEKLIDAADIIYIDTIGYEKNRYGPVKFNHKRHQDEYKNPKGEVITCTECHHDYKNGDNNVWQKGQPVQLCIECHDPSKSDGEKKKLQLAFHENCKDCHEKAVNAGLSEDAPYKKCNTCMGNKI